VIAVRKSADRGYADHGWLRSYHTFSFADYYDPANMGFDTHGHRDMEIVSYVLAGALAHKDSTGKGSVIRPGDVQRMSAGRGIRHSEYNASDSELVHFLQIWIEPNVRGIEPGYEETRFDAASKRGALRLIASPDGRGGSVTIHQDATIHAALLDGAERVTHRLAPGRRAYVHVARGAVTVNGQRLDAGDGLKATDTLELVLERGEQAEVLLFDLP
jgi:redox-sensitive bicupin YhaK (pirin superfamily)